MARFASALALSILVSLPAAALADGPASGTPSPERVRRGVVTVAARGKPATLGLVLPGDGRVVTALSALAGDGSVRLLYADGSALGGRVAHRDERWDLALVVPEAKRWTDGIGASLEAPEKGELRAFALAGPSGISARLVPFEGMSDATSRSGLALPGAFRVPLATPTAGAPVVDGRGAVSGLVVRACKPASPERAKPAGGARDTRPSPCEPVFVVAPVEAVRAFVMATPATATIPAPWLGVAGVPEERGEARGVRIVAVAPKSPAAAAGVRGASDGTGDVVVRVDERTTENPEQLAEAIATRAVGDRVTLHVVRQGKEKALPVTLKAAP